MVSSTQRLAFVTNGIALRMLEGGTAPNGGKGTAFDEITVSSVSIPSNIVLADHYFFFFQHIIVDEVHERSIECELSNTIPSASRPTLELTLVPPFQPTSFSSYSRLFSSNARISSKRSSLPLHNLSSHLTFGSCLCFSGSFS